MKRNLLILFTLLFFINLKAQTAEEAVNLIDDQDGIGIKAAALGNAFTAVADDYSAIYWNPAGLAQLKRGELSGALYNSQYRADVTYQDNLTSESQNYTKFNHFGIAYPFPTIRGSFVMAFGYNRVKALDNYTKFTGINPGSNNLGFDIENELGYYGILPFDLGLQQGQTIENKGSLDQWSMAAAIDLSPSFSAGATINFYTGKGDYKLTYSQDDVNTMNSYDIFDENNNLIEEFYYNYYDLQQRVSSDYSGFEFKLGGLFRFMRWFKLGGTITFPMNLKINETWSIIDELSYDIYVRDEQTLYEFIEEYDLGSGNFEYIIKVPYKFNAGIAFQNSFLLLSAAAQYTDFTQMEFDKPEDQDGSYYDDLFRQNKIFKENFRSQLTLSTGAEFNLFDYLQLRAGARYVPSPLKNVDSTFNKIYLSAGVGLNVSEGISLEAAYTLGIWQREKFYPYDWDDSIGMETKEEHYTGRFLLGARIYF